MCIRDSSNIVQCYKSLYCMVVSRLKILLLKETTFLLIGVDEVAHAGGGVVILEEVAAAAVRVAVQTFQNGQVIVAVGLHHAGDAGGEVGAVGLEGPGVQGVAIAVAVQNVVPAGNLSFAMQSSKSLDRKSTRLNSSH